MIIVKILVQNLFEFSFQKYTSVIQMHCDTIREIFGSCSKKNQRFKIHESLQVISDDKTNKFTFLTGFKFANEKQINAKK